MIIRNPFDYQLLQRTENSNGRFYNTPDGKLLPSVTTILSATKDNSYLDEWRNNIGEQKAAKITEEASRLGTELVPYPNDDFKMTVIKMLILDIVFCYSVEKSCKYFYLKTFHTIL